MNKCIVWGTGKEFNNQLHLIQYYELKGQIQVVGVTSKDSYYKSILSYDFIEKKDILKHDFDYLILASGKKNNIVKMEAKEMGIAEDIIVPIGVMSFPNFDFDKYQKIKNNIPSIFTPNCWGGLLYHSLALPFESPFINMFERHDDYLSFLKNPRYYIEEQMVFDRIEYDDYLKRSYPVGKCGDIIFHFNHYDTFEEALECWDKRKARINWDNILAMFFDEEEERINDFLSLPYKRKICFTPFNINHDDVVSVDYRKKCPDKPFWQIVNDTATGASILFDIFELILNNKIVPLSNIK